MTNDNPLFDRPPEQRHKPDGETLLDKVLHEIRSAGARGMVDEQLVDAFQSKGQPHKESTLRARRAELVKMSLVVKSRSKRKTAAGVNAAVWIASQFAAEPAAISEERKPPTPKPRTIQGGELRLAPQPCRVCGATTWRYPPADATEPQPVTCGGCGRFIGNHSPNDERST